MNLSCKWKFLRMRPISIPRHPRDPLRDHKCSASTAVSHATPTRPHPISWYVGDKLIPRYLIPDTRYLVFDDWCLMLNAWRLMLGAWSLGPDVGCLMLDAWCSILSAWCLMHAGCFMAHRSWLNHGWGAARPGKRQPGGRSRRNLWSCLRSPGPRVPG